MLLYSKKRGDMMGVNVISTVRRLVKAINQTDNRILFSQKEFVDSHDGHLVKLYCVSRVFNDGEKFTSEEIFKSTNNLYCLFFLRDYYDYIMGREFVDEPSYWPEVRENLKKKGVKLYNGGFKER